MDILFLSSMFAVLHKSLLKISRYSIVLIETSEINKVINLPVVTYVSHLKTKEFTEICQLPLPFCNTNSKIMFFKFYLRRLLVFMYTAYMLSFEISSSVYQFLASFGIEKIFFNFFGWSIGGLYYRVISNEKFPFVVSKTDPHSHRLPF